MDEALSAGSKADAVALYQSGPGATIKSVAEDLGINTETLRNWIRVADGRRSGSHSTPLDTLARPRTRVRPSLPQCGSGFVSGGGARHSPRRPGISPGRRAGEEPQSNYCLFRCGCPSRGGRRSCTGISGDAPAVLDVKFAVVLPHLENASAACIWRLRRTH
ncbi:transposase [Streptomyces sp. H27-C3]|uniref:transposase n=1 Tax=Streptomyces sp. H27-C3 TaxID=3046305 RepID=UPI0024BA19D4|nr:transposase [Streptomyces sp. H27-C3]MDJ0464279.1 transposase [Streptomyces sp. H27-C3]